jgi:hypothetical protein
MGRQVQADGMAALVVLGFLIALALLGPRLGTDSRSEGLQDRYWWPPG